jgi:hypothetical protein
VNPNVGAAYTKKSRPSTGCAVLKALSHLGWESPNRTPRRAAFADLSHSLQDVHSTCVPWPDFMVYISTIGRHSAIFAYPPSIASPDAEYGLSIVLWK